jgi:hypothetical protein
MTDRRANVGRSNDGKAGHHLAGSLAVKENVEFGFPLTKKNQEPTLVTWSPWWCSVGRATTSHNAFNKLGTSNRNWPVHIQGDAEVCRQNRGNTEYTN